MNTRTFLLANGANRVEVHGRPIHYKAQDGTWQPIDTALVATSKAGFARANERNVLRSYMPGGTDGWVRAESDMGAVSFRPLGAAPLSTVAGAKSAGWSRLWRNTDLNLSPTPGGLKETITLASADVPASFRFGLRTEGLTPRLNADSSVSLLDANGNPSLLIARPWMQDAAGKRSYAIAVALQDTVQGAVYTMIPDPAWLSAANYPVTIDPTITVYNPVWNGTGAAYAPNDDRVMRGDSCGSIYPDGEPEVLIGPDPDHSGSLCKAVMIFGSNLASIGIPPNATICGATFKLAVDCDGDEGGDTIIVDDIPFTPGDAVSWTSIGNAYNADPFHPSSVTGLANPYYETDFDITDIAQYWVTKRTVPLGLQLTAPSASYPIYAHADYYDSLEITYANLNTLMYQGNPDITSMFGANAHYTLSHCCGVNTNYPLNLAELDQFKTTSGIVRSDLLWYSTERTDRVDGNDDVFDSVQYFVGAELNKGIRPMIILEPVREHETFGYQQDPFVRPSVCNGPRLPMGAYESELGAPPPFYPTGPFWTGLAPPPPPFYPAWAGLAPPPPPYYPPSDFPNAEATWGQKFANWARLVVDSVASVDPQNQVIWELTNEPNFFWLPNAASDYGDLCAKTIAAIRNSTVNPNATILLGDVAELEGDVDWQYLEKTLQVLSSTPIDVGTTSCSALSQVTAISMHPYRYGNPPEQAAATFARVRVLVNKYSPNREIPLVSSEAGYATTTDEGNTGFNQTWETQAEYLVRQRLFNAGERIAASVWYDWKDDTTFYTSDPVEQASGRDANIRCGMTTQWPVIEDFETPGIPSGWYADSDGPEATLVPPDMDPDSPHAHGNVLALSAPTVLPQGHAWITTNDVIANMPLIPANATAIGMWVKADKAFSFSCVLQSENGTPTTLTLVPSDYWTAHIPLADPNDTDVPTHQDKYLNGWRYIQASLTQTTSRRLWQVIFATNTDSVVHPLDLYLDNITYTYPPSVLFSTGNTPKWAKTSFAAAQTLMTQLQGYRFVRYLEDEPADPTKYVMLLENESGSAPTYALALWTRDTENAKSFSLGQQWTVGVTDMMGNDALSPGNDIAVTQAPEYVKIGTNSQYYGQMADLASWSWAGLDNSGLGTAHPLRNSVIMAGQGFETAFTIVNPSTTEVRDYSISFGVPNDTSATLTAHDVVHPLAYPVTISGAANCLTATFSLDPGQSVTIPLRLMTYRRDQPVSVNVTVQATHILTVEYTDSASIPLVLGNPMTLTAGPALHSGSDFLLNGRLCLGVEAPGLTYGENLQLQVYNTFGMVSPGTQSFGLPATPTNPVITPPYVISAPVQLPTSDYQYSVKVVDGANHVLAVAENRFLGSKVYDDTPSTGSDAPWPIGLSFWAGSAAFQKSAGVSPDLGFDMLSMHQIAFSSDFPRLNAKIPDPRNDPHEYIPADATAIGMWINPHNSYVKLMSHVYANHPFEPSEAGEYLYLYGYRDAQYNFAHPQDNMLLEDEGWRWVTIPFGAPVTKTAAPLAPVPPLQWNRPIYLEWYGTPLAYVDICGLTYLTEPSQP